MDEVQCGFSGEDTPRVAFPMIVGRTLSPCILVGMDARSVFVGDLAISRIGIFKISNPIQNGLVVKWYDMENVWNYALLEKCSTARGECPIFVTEIPGCPPRDREKLTQTVFEEYEAPAFFVAVQQMLSLYASGRLTGVVVDAGHDVTHAVAVYEGHCIRHSVRKLDVAGRQITDYLMNRLLERGHDLSDKSELQIVQNIKEKLCYVSSDPHDELIRAEAVGDGEAEYELPDGSRISICAERFSSPEILFNPSQIECETSGIHHLTASLIAECDHQLQHFFSQNLVLAGGSTLFEGFSKRLSAELEQLLGFGVTIDSPDAPNLSAWVGGSMLTSLSSFGKSWITKAEYEEIGAGVVERKCY